MGAKLSIEAVGEGRDRREGLKKFGQYLAKELAIPVGVAAVLTVVIFAVTNGLTPAMRASQAAGAEVNTDAAYAQALSQKTGVMLLHGSESGAETCQLNADTVYDVTVVFPTEIKHIIQQYPGRYDIIVEFDYEVDAGETGQIRFEVSDEVGNNVYRAFGNFEAADDLLLGWSMNHPSDVPAPTGMASLNALRGEAHFSLYTSYTEPERHQVTSYDDCTANWGFIPSMLQNRTAE